MLDAVAAARPSGRIGRVLIHPWDDAHDADEWRTWLAQGRDFGTLVVNGPESRCPDVVPVHYFMAASEEIALHLARANPVWRAIERNNHVAFSVVDDYAFIPAPWRLSPDAAPETGVPTSYYSAVVFEGTATIVAEANHKADLLGQQMRTYQPDGGYGEISASGGPYARMLAGIQFALIQIESVRAKFKYDDHKDAELRAGVSTHLGERGRGVDSKAKEQLDRRRGRAGRIE